jgi:cob(I)alamin adenosyltransferase
MSKRLTKIYTKTGDTGKTGLADGSSMEKFNPRIESLGSIDELNSIIGIILTEKINKSIKETLEKIQHDLFDIGGELSIPNTIIITENKIQFIEDHLDLLNKSLSPLDEFILPGGSKAAAFCHQARTVCRRAERVLFKLNQTDKINKDSLKYINRLSDFLFVLARYTNKIDNVKDILWQKSI